MIPESRSPLSIRDFFHRPLGEDPSLMVQSRARMSPTNTARPSIAAPT